jgi:uncharacterized protein involved in response to NO
MNSPIIQITEKTDKSRADNRSGTSGFALFASGFRPFFLFGSLFGFMALGYFSLLISGAVETLPSAWDMVTWHRHEMLFGYAGAIIAGFLFTAVPNWTGQPTAKGVKLALVVLLWLAGRAVVFTSAYIPTLLVAVIDVSFFAACTAAIVPALIKSRNKRNYFFIVLLTLLAIANGLTHWGGVDNTVIADTGIRLGLSIVILMMVVIGGRVIPFFTEKPLGITIRRNPVIERFTLISTVIALVLGVIEAPTTILGIAFLLAAIANAWRFSQWQSVKTLRVPLLWVLHAGYAWLVIGFTTKAAYYLGSAVPPSIATHAFTAGGVGVLTLGMMARVSLGHSGRQLEVGKPIICAFACINAAALSRVFGVWLFPEFTLRWLEAASLFWLLAFGIFIIIYAPIFMRPRADGREG